MALEMVPLIPGHLRTNLLIPAHRARVFAQCFRLGALTRSEKAPTGLTAVPSDMAARVPLQSLPGFLW
jgi:hypothetical protein